MGGEKRAVAHLTIFSHNTLQSKYLFFPNKIDGYMWREFVVRERSNTAAQRNGMGCWVYPP